MTHSIREPHLDSTPPSRGPAWWRRPRPAVAVTVVAVLLTASAGAAWVALRPQSEAEDYIEIFLTDAPANMTSLDVRISGVFVGLANYPIHVDVPTLDLLSVQGPSQAVRVASGFVPRGADVQMVRIVFAGASAILDGREVILDVPEGMLTVEFDRGGLERASSALLFDVDVDRSVVVTENGFSFRPFVASIFLHEYSNKPSKAPDGGPESRFHAEQRPDFEREPAKEPDRQSTERPPPELTRDDPTITTEEDNPDEQRTPPTTPDDRNEPQPEGSQENATDNVAPDLGNSTSSGGTGDAPPVVDDLGLIIQFAAGEGEAVATALAAMGVATLSSFPGQDAVYVQAQASQVLDIAGIDGVIYIEKEKPVFQTLDSSREAIRSALVTHSVTGLRDANGNVIDGRGVGVAVIDSGIDATHPDLPYDDGLRVNPVVVENYKIESISYQFDLVPLPHTDTTSGHGTHVTGIIAGQGTTDASYRGVAPGAKIYGLGVGEAATTLWTNQGLSWVVDNHDRVDPPIRVVSNSWSTGTDYDPNALSSRLVRQLVDEGVVVVFAAGNAGGNGNSIRTSAEGQNPAEGVIMVAAYDDEGTGARDGSTYAGSSRGKSNVPSSWPDVAAPGVEIMSAKALAGFSTGVGGILRYTALTGTSQATPHVAGVAALMLQADGSLEPADVERIIEATALEYSDGGSYARSSDDRYDGSHYAKGHGLVDAWAAVAAVLAS